MKKEMQVHMQISCYTKVLFRSLEGCGSSAQGTDLKTQMARLTKKMIAEIVRHMCGSLPMPS